MQISLRSHLIAGTAAVVGAGAIMIPAAQGQVVVPALQAPVALAAFANPITALLDTALIAQDYFTGVYYNGADAPTPGAGEANWPYAGFDQTGGDLLNYLLYTQQSLGYYSFVGEAPQNINDASPALRQFETNISDYLNVGLYGANAALYYLADGLWDFPSAVLNAAQLALAGQFSEALSVLTAAVITPIQLAVENVVSAGTYIASNVAAKLGAVVAALPQIATTFAGAVAGGAALQAEALATAGTAVLTNLLSLNIEGAWNAAVSGFLSPAGAPGVALNLLAGAGIQTGPILDPATDIPTNFVPSIRTATQAAVWTLADALSTTAPGGAAAVPAAAVTKRSAARSAAAAPRSAAADKAVKAVKAPRAARAAKATAGS
ncbi:MAG: hypothetical protein ACR2JI_11510 [Mycobacterium sp.]